MTRVTVKSVIAEQQKCIRELRAASPVDATELALAVAHLKWLRSIGKPPSAQRARRIAAIRGTLETLLKPCMKPGMNPALWDRAAVAVVRLCDQQGKALKTRHEKPGASLDKGEAMKNAWTSGKWATKEICAEEHGPTIGLKFDAARRHLRGA